MLKSMKSSNKRVIIAFILGCIGFLVLDIALNWDEASQVFKEGYERGKTDHSEIKAE